MRGGRLCGLDGDAARLAAAGLVRLGAQEWVGDAAGAPAWLGPVRAASFADAWLAFGEPPVPGLRVPAGEVLRALAYRAAELVLQAREGDVPAVLEWLGRRSAEAREQAGRAEVAHPAEPAALALVWHGVQAVTADDGGGDGEAHGRRIDERGEAYVRERHHRQDTLALMLACARIAAAALVESCGGDPGRVDGWLEEDAARYMALGGPAPLWVPGRPGQPTG
ncbi:hypothetical protein [Kitasatospora sp. NBC_01300]|uniref:hypothetical protein n=1 Tax=Kitasatospora sp. NBC_01300 TaxID=2903574 RepID=UPI00352BE8EF|nr:hypothetical protein OG556_00100 [Kitasatospora sp. NBC_01300]WSK08409.1 hypothetical protein OG556_33620 [Kitasatospora sp. NBC_01300]